MLNITPQYVEKKITLVNSYAHLHSGSELDLLFKVSDGQETFYIVQSSETVFPLSIPERYFVAETK